MPLWRLYARDADGWLDLNLIVQGSLFDAEVTCAQQAAWRHTEVSAEEILTQIGEDDAPQPEARENSRAP